MSQCGRNFMAWAQICVNIILAIYRYHPEKESKQSKYR